MKFQQLRLLPLFLGEKIRLGTCFYRCERTGARRERLSVLIERIGLTRRHGWIESILEWGRLKCRKWVWISRGREKWVCCCLRGWSCKRKDVIGEWRLLCLLMLRLLNVRIHGCILTVRWCLLREEIGNAKTIAAGCGCCCLLIRWWRGILILDSRTMSARTSATSTERTLLNWASAFASSSRTFWGSSLSLKMRSREKLFKSCSVCCLRERERMQCRDGDQPRVTAKSMTATGAFSPPYVPNDFPALPKDCSVPKRERKVGDEDCLETL